MNKPLAAVLTAAVVLMAASSTEATMPMQKKAKEAGFPAANCMYCHGEKVTNNERGAFLIKQKEEKKAKEVDVAWLKDFVEAKK
jgi:cytochrome c553